jgi:cell pole-organizing protein PopZ
VPDVLDLTPDMEVQANAPAFRRIQPSDDLTFDVPPPPPEPVAVAPEPPPPPPPMPNTVELARRRFMDDTGTDRSLLSAATTAAVDSAFNSLANTVLVQNSLTLEDIVREMLRPMLKSWLDDNLPNMVERMVRAEIERVARGRN